MRNAYHISTIFVIVAALLTLTIYVEPDHWGVWAIAIVICLLFLILNYAADDTSNASWINRILRRKGSVSIYTFLVDGVLTGLARKISPETAEDKKPPTSDSFAKFQWWANQRAIDATDLKKLQGNPWSWPTMDAALKLAVIYPLFLLLGQWWWTGTDTGIGPAIILQAFDGFWWRSALFCPLALLLAVKLMKTASQRHIWSQANDKLLWISLVAPVTFPFAGAGAAAIVATGAFVGVVSISGAAAGASSFALTAATAVVFPFIGTVGVTVVFAFAVAFAFAGVILLSKSCQNGKGLRGYAILTVAAFMLVSFILTLIPVTQEQAFDRRLIVFALGLLPLINAVFDYLSYGLTIHLIKKGRKSKKWPPIVFGTLDAIAAVILLFAVAFALLCTIAIINHFAATPLLDISQILNDLRSPETRGPYTWLYLTLFSTLIPTLVHLCIATFSALIIVPRSYKSKIAHWVSPDSPGQLTTLSGTFLAAATGAIYAAFVVLMFSTLWWAITNIETFGLWLLSAVEHAAHTLNLL